MNKYVSYITEIIKGRLTHKNVPIYTVLCITNRCNLKCTYCYEEYYDRNHREFTTGQILNLIDELVDMGTKYISLNGGESLLRNDIEIIVNKIKQKKVLCHLSTNGLLVKQHIPLLKKIDSIAISIDGIRDNNDLNRGEGTYDKIIEGIELLYKNKIKFHTHTVLTKNNKNAVKDILKLGSKFGFKTQFSSLRCEDSPNKKICLADDELRSVVKDILKYKKSGLPVFFSSEAYTNFLNWPFSYKKERIYGNVPKDYRPIHCYMKKFYCHIEANGMVYPCIGLVNKFKAANFIEVGFKKAWENLSHNDCLACYNVCCTDHNLIFALNPQSLFNAVRVVIDRITK